MADNTARGGAWPNIISRAAACRRVNFSVGLKIGTCRHMPRCFPVSLPPECRSERDAPVGVFVGWNGGHRKKLLTARCSDGGCGFCEAS